MSKSNLETNPNDFEIYTLTFSLPHQRLKVPWSKEVEVMEDMELLELHYYIQYLVKFDDDHLFEFFIGKSPRNIVRVVSDEKRLNQIYPLVGTKLYYLFDFGDNWLFQIKKSRKKQFLNKRRKYPRVISSTGIKPDQYNKYRGETFD